LDTLFGDINITPERLLRLDDEELRKAGLSAMKVKYLKDLATKILTGKIDFEKLEAMDDEEVIATLTQVKGIGRWTAEMYLMFSLGRLDVFPMDDIALRTAMTYVFELPKTEFDSQAEIIAEQWRPFRTIACWYLYSYLDMLRNAKKKI